jgi:predicted N-acetyltransferase YhbS
MLAIMITIRPARRDETHALTQLCRRSKAYWGYDAAFLQASESALTVDDEKIAHGHVLVAADESGALLGVVAALPLEQAAFDLDLLFVAPEAIRSGVGEALFHAIVDVLKREEAKRLVILADPNAAAFYARMGAKRIGEAPSDSIPGRVLPLFEILIG